MVLVQEPQPCIRTPEAPCAAGEGLHGSGAWGSNPNLPETLQGTEGVPCSDRQVRDIQTALSAMFILGAAQEEASSQVLYFPHHSLIKLSFQGCPSPNVDTSVSKMWLGDLMVTHWCLLQLPQSHLPSGHSLRCSACPPFSLAILPSAWTEEMSQVPCKIRKMEKKNYLPTPNHPESCSPTQPHRLGRFPMR